MKLVKKAHEKSQKNAENILNGHVPTETIKSNDFSD